MVRTEPVRENLANLGEEALPRVSAAVANGPVAQDAALAPVAAAVEKTPGTVLGHAATGVDDWRVVKRSRERHAIDATFPTGAAP